MDIVMNDIYIRSNIFNFFRNKEFKICSECNKICCDNYGNKKLKYVFWDNFVCCHKCFKKLFFNIKNKN